MELALLAAEQPHDPEHLGRTLHYLQRRVAALDEVCGFAMRIVGRGDDEQAHPRLLISLDAVRGLEREFAEAGALLEAEQLREHGDPDHLGKALLYLHRRATALELVFEHAMRYVQFGLDELERLQLVTALEAVQRLELKETGGEPETFGSG